MANIWQDISDQARPIARILVNDDKSTSNVDILDYSVIGSYSWSGTPANPIAIIPGVPKAFVSWKGGQLRQTLDKMMVDEDHYMNAKFPLEVLIRAVDYCNVNEFNWQQVDICTERNNLRKLYGITDSSVGALKEEFRIDVERIGRTVMFTRWESVDQEFSKYPTFGKNFEEVCSKVVDKDCSQWHCISKYSFAGLKVVVRFEVDCADYGQNEVDALGLAGKPSIPRKFNSSTLSFKPSPPPFASKFVGSNNPPLIELTTRSDHRGFPNEKWAQMYFSGTRKLVLGRHSKGHITSTETYSLKQVEVLSGGKPVAELKAFGSLLRAIVEFVRNRGEGELFSIVWTKADGKVVQIYRRKVDASTRVAPENVLFKTRMTSILF